MRRLEVFAGAALLMASVALFRPLFSPDERPPAAGAYAITPVVEKGATAAFYAPIDVSAQCPTYQADYLIYPSGQRRMMGVERLVTSSPPAQTEVRVPLNARDGSAFYSRVIRVECPDGALSVTPPPIPFEIVSRRGGGDG